MPLTPEQIAGYYKTQSGVSVPLSPAQYEANLNGTASAPVVPLATATGEPVKPITTTTTIGDAYKLPVSEDPAIKAARDAELAFTNNESQGIPNVDESAIRAQVLANMQAEINATNSLYAEKLTEAKIAGAGRVGNVTSINTRRGLAGSDFGNASTDTVNNANNSIYAGIEAEKNSKIGAILTKARDTGTQQIADKTNAIKAGLDAHLKYLEDSATRKTTNATSAAQFIYDQQLKPTDLTKEQLQQTADGYGITPQDILNAFTDVKKKGDEAQATKDAQAIKDSKAGLTTVSAGSSVVDSKGNIISTAPAKPATPKSSSTYASFTNKPTASVISKVNAYLASIGASKNDINAVNGNEIYFYKVFNSIPKTSTSGTSLPIAP